MYRHGKFSERSGYEGYIGLFRPLFATTVDPGVGTGRPNRYQ